MPLLLLVDGGGAAAVGVVLDIIAGEPRWIWLGVFEDIIVLLLLLLLVLVPKLLPPYLGVLLPSSPGLTGGGDEADTEAVLPSRECAKEAPLGCFVGEVVGVMLPPRKGLPVVVVVVV